GHVFEELSSHVVRRARPRGSVVQLARVLLRERDELFHVFRIDRRMHHQQQVLVIHAGHRSKVAHEVVGHNFSANVKYQFYKNDAREAIASVGVDWDIGGSGQSKVGAEPFSTWTPAIFVGKGFGDLPDSVKYLRPFAVTGSAGYAIPSRTSTTTFDEDGNASVEQHP